MAGKTSRGYSECDQDVGAYYDVLYNFTKATNDLNSMACDDGAEPKKLSRRFQSLINAFMQLCMIDENTTQIDPARKRGPKKKETETEQSKREVIPDNFIHEENGWGICPVCRKKMIKLTSNTRLENFPAYCKMCKTEYIVNWWNVDKKEIPYQRHSNKASRLNYI